MKIRIFGQVIVALSMLLILASCEKDELTSPVIINFSADKYELALNETVNFTIEAEADFLVIWLGDKSHNYNDQKTDAEKFSEYTNEDNPKYAPTSVGLMVRDKVYPYAYSKPGTYSVVLVASNIQDWTGKKLETVDSLTVVVQ
jgi:PKD repeat protein